MNLIEAAKLMYEKGVMIESKSATSPGRWRLVQRGDAKQLEEVGSDGKPYVLSRNPVRLWDYHFYAEDYEVVEEPKP